MIKNRCHPAKAGICFEQEILDLCNAQSGMTKDIKILNL